MQEVSITTEGIQKNLKNFKPSLPHGRQGIGRLTFFAFAQRARWNTVYDKDGTRYEYYIDMEKDSLNQYDDNGGKEPKVTEKESGTEVIFTQLHQFSKDEIVARIKIEFFWFLELNRSRYYKILIDGEILSKLVKMIEDRQKVIQGLKELVFDKELYAKEVLHIQNTVENH